MPHLRKPPNNEFRRINHRLVSVVATTAGSGVGCRKRAEVSRLLVTTERVTDLRLKNGMVSSWLCISTPLSKKGLPRDAGSANCKTAASESDMTGWRDAPAGASAGSSRRASCERPREVVTFGQLLLAAVQPPCQPTSLPSQRRDHERVRITAGTVLTRRSFSNSAAAFELRRSPTSAVGQGTTRLGGGSAPKWSL